jgi:hypothetical protein
MNRDPWYSVAQVFVFRNDGSVYLLHDPDLMPSAIEDARGVWTDEANRRYACGEDAGGEAREKLPGDVLHATVLDAIERAYKGAGEWQTR